MDPRDPHDPHKRHKTKHPGVYWRQKADGTRSYIIWYRGTDGRYRFESVPGGQGDAVRARARVVDRIAHGHKMAPTKVKMEDYAKRWLESQSGLSPKTVETYEQGIVRITKYLGRYRVTEVDVHRVAKFVSDMKKDGYSTWTIRGTVTPLRHILRSAVRDGLLPNNPVSLLRRGEMPKSDQRTMQTLDTEEIQVLLEAATDHYRPLFAIAIFTGMRHGELLNLTWDDIDWVKGIIYVRQSKTEAGVRGVVLMPSLKKLLAAHKLAQRDSKYVFQTVYGDQMQQRRVSHALSDTVKRARLEKKICFHDLRHTHASILIHQGQTDAFICEQMGHANAAITRRLYGHLFDRDARREDAREKLEAEFGQVLGK